MDLQNIIIVAVVALLVIFFVGSKLGIRRGGGGTPSNPPRSNPDRGGEGIFTGGSGSPVEKGDRDDDGSVLDEIEQDDGGGGRMRRS